MSKEKDKDNLDSYSLFSIDNNSSESIEEDSCNSEEKNYSIDSKLDNPDQSKTNIKRETTRKI